MSDRSLTREQRTERLRRLRARESARKLRLSAGPLMEQPVEYRIRFAIFDPGAITPRGDNFEEPLYAWQARAAAYLLPETDIEVRQDAMLGLARSAQPKAPEISFFGDHGPVVADWIRMWARAAARSVS